MDRFSAAITDRFAEEVDGLVKHETSMLITTVAVDYADYRQRIGFLKGLARAVLLMQKIKQELSRAEDHDDRAPMHSRRYEE